MQLTARSHDVAQRPVDAEAHDRMRLERLEVDVGRAFARGLGEERVDEADDRRVVLGLEQVLDLGHVLHQAREIERRIDLVDDARRRAVVGRVRLRDRLLERVAGDHDDAQQPERALQFGDRLHRRRIADPHVAHARLVVVGRTRDEHVMVARERVRDLARDTHVARNGRQRRDGGLRAHGAFGSVVDFSRVGSAGIDGESGVRFGTTMPGPVFDRGGRIVPGMSGMIF